MCSGDTYGRKSLKAAIPKVKGMARGKRDIPKVKDMVGGRISNLIIGLN